MLPRIIPTTPSLVTRNEYFSFLAQETSDVPPPSSSKPTPTMDDPSFRESQCICALEHKPRNIILRHS